MPSEEEIRIAVTRVVSGVLARTGEAPASVDAPVSTQQPVGKRNIAIGADHGGISPQGTNRFLSAGTGF